MIAQASFALRGRNPDILTCIANLSNDEVFTPPEFANRMLDTLAESWASSHGGASIWEDPSVTFLDPCTKSGVFLREITSRLTEGLAGKIPDLHKRVDHILTKQVFGIAITRLTALLARRSLYCSKVANGTHSVARSFADVAGNVAFPRVEHTWDGERCLYCGAGKSVFDRAEGLETHAYAFIHGEDVRATLGSLFGGRMQFDVIIGNPPYQMSTGGGTATQQATPVYHEFVRQAKRLDPQFVVMVTPSRWFSGGMPVLDSFRSEMLKDRRIRELVDYPDSRDAFTGVDVAGGINYFLWDAIYDGPCLISTVSQGSFDTSTRYLDAYAVFVRQSSAVSLIEKVVRAEGFASVAPLVSAVSPFGLPTSFRGVESPSGMRAPVVVRSTVGRQWAERQEVPKNTAWIDEWKVLLSATSSEHAGQADKNGMRRVFSRIEVLEPGVVVTHSYLVLGPMASEAETRNVAGYLQTTFVRFLVSLVITTQHVSKASFLFVPTQDFSKSWTDEELFNKYGLTEQDRNIIAKTIRPLAAAVVEDLDD